MPEQPGRVEAAEDVQGVDGVEVTDAAAPVVVADEVLLDSVDLARRALLEVTPAETVGSVVGHSVEDERVLTFLFASDLAGYPGWRWSVTIARVDDGEPTVLETELMPGDTALLAPEWIPWSERLADYRAAQEAAAAAAAEAADGTEDDEATAADLESDDEDEDLDEDDEDDDLDEDDEDDDADLDDDAELDAAFGHDDGDDQFDGIDIDALDDSVDDDSDDSDDSDESDESDDDSDAEDPSDDADESDDDDSDDDSDGSDVDDEEDSDEDDEDHPSADQPAEPAS